MTFRFRCDVVFDEVLSPIVLLSRRAAPVSRPKSAHSLLSLPFGEAYRAPRRRLMPRDTGLLNRMRTVRILPVNHDAVRPQPARRDNRSVTWPRRSARYRWAVPEIRGENRADEVEVCLSYDIAIRLGNDRGHASKGVGNPVSAGIVAGMDADHAKSATAG